jgi:acetamidase/formamidase
VQLIVHKDAGASMKWPRAEDAANYYSMGMADTLDGALREAIGATVEFLQGRGLSKSEAYALCSLAVDFRIGEAVNNVLMVYGVLPKKLFKK